VRPATASLVATALSLRGTPYLMGGVTPQGFDCSGFVQYVFGRHGRRVGRDVEALYREGSAIRREQVAAGDLLFFRTSGRGPSHVGIALDGQTFVHAPSSRGLVRVERLTGEYWQRRFLGARRLVSP
jgi:cell wall-associated NlpC family hydrolase